MRINVHLRGIDLIDVEFHAGSKGLLLDVTVFQPRVTEPSTPVQQMADLSGTARTDLERAPGPAWEEDQPVVVRTGFQRSDR